MYVYGKCPKILYIKVSEQMAYGNCADLHVDKKFQEQFELGLHCLKFC